MFMWDPIYAVKYTSSVLNVGTYTVPLSYSIVQK